LIPTADPIVAEGLPAVTLVAVEALVVQVMEGMEEAAEEEVVLVTRWHLSERV